MLQAAQRAWLAPWSALSGTLIKEGAMVGNSASPYKVVLLRHNELDAAMAKLKDEAFDECSDQLRRVPFVGQVGP